MSNLQPGVLTEVNINTAMRVPRSAGPLSYGQLTGQAISHPGTGFYSRHIDAGILAYNIQLNQIWCKAGKYVEQIMVGSGQNFSGGLLDSDYASINASLLAFESTIMACHRFDKAEFPGKALSLLYQNRGYWTAFLHIQFQYHAIRCLLDHPLICLHRLRRGSSSCMPVSFAQASAEDALLHSNWIVRFVDMVQDKGFELLDPFFAHCASIAATIQLHHANAQSELLQKSARAGVAKCIKFVDGIAKQWPAVQQMVYVLHLRLNVTYADISYNANSLKTCATWGWPHQNGYRYTISRQLQLKAMKATP